MTKACAFCGESFEAKRVSAKFCSGLCRAKNGQRPHAAVSALPAKPSGGRAAAVERELIEADRLSTALGQSALGLAVLLDGGEGGSAAASLNRELRATLADALKGVGALASPLDKARDELARRRAARGA